MPVYEYRCLSCEHQFEEWQEVGSAPPPCPQCQSEVRKIFHPVRTIFKGSGFYITDTRAEKSKSSKSSTPPATESKPAEKTAGNSETKAAASTPPAPTPS